MFHGLAWIIGITSFRVGLVAPQVCGSVAEGDLEEAIFLTASWAANNVNADGTYTYRFDRSAGEDLGGYNQVRHAALVSALYQAVESGDNRWLEAADLGFGYMTERLVRNNDWAAFAAPGGEVQLGSTALMVAAAIHRRRATGDTVNDALIHEGARFLIAQQDATGAPSAAWDRVTERPVPDRFGPFATGEAAWALALAENDFPGRGYAEASDAVLRYIVEDRRDREDRILRLPDHWASYAFAERNRTLTSAELVYVERLAGDFALMSRVESQRTGEGLQGFVRYGHALGAGVGSMGEGMMALWRLGQVDPASAGGGPRAGFAVSGFDSSDLTVHVECVTSLLVERQVRPDDVVSNADAEVGAWFRDDITQMDDQQHPLSALLAAREILFGSVLAPGAGNFLPSDESDEVDR